MTLGSGILGLSILLKKVPLNRNCTTRVKPAPKLKYCFSINIIMIFKHSSFFKTLKTANHYRMASYILNEYKFYVDFNGLMYFDDEGSKNYNAIIRDAKFIQKFYQEMQATNDSLKDRYPYFSEFWGERNYLRCAVAPVVFTHLQSGFLEFSVGLKTPFDVSLLRLQSGGQLSHPYPTTRGQIRGVFSNGLLQQVLPSLLHKQDGIYLESEGRQHRIESQ